MKAVDVQNEDKKLILAPSWHVWSDLRELMNSFYNDDLLQRVFILWVMAILVVYGNNAPLVDQDIAAMRATVGAYLTARVSTNSMHLYYSFASYHHRAQQRLWFVLATFALCLYIPLFVENLSFRAKIGFTAAAIGTEELVWVFCYSPIAKRLLQARYTTAVDVPHEVDRIGAFYILVLGEFLYQIVVSSPAAIGFNVDLMRAIWTLIIAFCLNWMYVHNDGSLQGLHPLKYDIIASFLWITLHLPLVASLLAGGHVASTSAKGDDFDDAHRWLLCASLGTGMICLYGIALLHKTQDPPCFLILDKVSMISLLFFSPSFLLPFLLRVVSLPSLVIMNAKFP